MRHVLIDTDTGSDDAVAPVIALTHPDIRVEAITVVASKCHGHCCQIRTG
jgi:purine nucleosidase